MIFNPTFSNQGRLLVAALPQVFKEGCFALKGGTAINLFVRDMPTVFVLVEIEKMVMRRLDKKRLNG